MSSVLETIQLHLAPVLLVIFRFAGLTIFGPLIGSPVIPVKVKVYLTFIIGLSVYPLLSSKFSGVMFMDINLWVLIPMVAMEITLGAVIGFLAGLPLVAAQTSGLIMGQQMGLGFARFYNPTIDDEADVVGQMLFFLAVAGFLAMGGHEQMILAVIHSFDYVPLGGFTPDTDLLAMLCGMLLAVFELALRIAAPLLALIFLETVAMGFVAKTVPQLNILSLGFPIRILAGIFIIIMGLVAIDQVLMEGIDDMLNSIFLWVQSN